MDTTALNRIRYFLGAARSVIRSRFFGGGPFFISHLITTRCFARCPTCLWRGDSPEEPDTGKIIDFYRRAARNGFVSTTFWGGEPLLRNDIARITSACRSFGLVTGLITNGRLLPRRAAELAPSLDFLIVSVDFPNEEHDRFRGVPGMLNNIVIGVERLRAVNQSLKVFMNSVVSRMNDRYIGDLVSFAEERSLSVTFESVNYGDAQFERPEGREVKNLRLAPDGEREAFEQIRHLKREHRSINNSDSYLRLFASGHVHYTCHAPKICLRIEPEGSVTNCLDRAQPLGNVYREPLEEILAHPQYALLREKAEGCSRCVDTGAVESSLFWDFTPEVLYNSLKLFVW
ncbi:MAG: radical SAM protein [Candidatus Latescibacterota bacterium]